MLFYILQYLSSVGGGWRAGAADLEGLRWRQAGSGAGPGQRKILVYGIIWSACGNIWYWYIVVNGEMVITGESMRIM